MYKACEEAGYILLITADHGNAEQMLNAETGEPHTAHTTNRVPFIMTGDPAKLGLLEDEETNKEGGEVEGKEEKVEDETEKGALCDVAPTVLDLLGVEKPEGMRHRDLLYHILIFLIAEMTGRSLLLRK